MTNQDPARYADIFAALGSEPRLLIMRLLFATYPDGMTAGDIQAKLQIPNSTLSHHLEKLRVEGLVNSKKDKQYLWYTASPQTMEDLLSFLTGRASRERVVELTSNASPEESFMLERFFASIFEKLFGFMSEKFSFRGFERFTQKAITVILCAQGEARRLGHNFVGTEQILLGLIAEGSGIASQFLTSVGVNLENAQIEVEKIIGRGRGNLALEIPFTPRAKQVLELSQEESQQLGHNYVGTEHLLLGILKEGEASATKGVAIRVLQNLGVDLASLEQRLRRSLT